MTDDPKFDQSLGRSDDENPAIYECSLFQMSFEDSTAEKKLYQFQSMHDKVLEL